MSNSEDIPENSSQQCPDCGQAFCLESSPDSFGVSCPHCGELLWLSGSTLSRNSLTGVYHNLLAGDEDAARRLWQACSVILMSHAQKHLQGVPQKMADAEDIVQEAFASFIKAARMGRFPDFKDRDDLWKLLFTITKRKAIDLRRKESRRKTSGESAFQSPDNERAGIQDIPADMSEEEASRLLSESVEDSLKLLTPEQRQYALAKLEGYTNREIAEKFGIAVRSVERKLHLIRRMWQESHHGK